MTDVDKLSKQANDFKRQLDSMLQLGEISLGQYDIAITTLAYDLALHGLKDDCLLMLANTSKLYFEEYAQQDLNDDEFYNKCELIFEVLSITGHIPIDVFATQKSAKA